MVRESKRTMDNDSVRSASRALVAHFDYELAKLLVAHVLKTGSAEAKKKLSNAVLLLVPEAAKQNVWARVLAWTEDAGAKYVASPAFQKKAQDTVEQNANYWIDQASRAAVQGRVTSVVNSHLANRDLKSMTDQIPGLLRAAIDKEVERVARETVAKKL